MKFKHMFKRTAVKNDAVNEKKTRFSARKPEVPDGLMKKCNACKSAVFVEEVKQNNYICPHCQNYFRMHAYRRIQMIADPDSFEEWDKGLQTRNPLQFKGYEEKLDKLKEKTGLDEAVVTGKLNINGTPTVVAVCDGRFMMASMGEVVGEKITRAVEKATEEKLPIIIFACSGGARMQEGIVSLMQMAKTSAALKRHSDEGLLYISVLTDPTTGGVTASFAMLGDIILAEPGALIGFAGPRVIEQTIGQKLPEGFQRSEFLLEHGFIDAIVERKEMRSTLLKILDMHITKTEQNTELVKNKEQMQTPVENDLECQDKMSAWDHVQLARDKNRPTGKDYIQLLFSDFVEMHGDRLYRDDPAVIGGVAKFHGEPVTILVQE